MTNIRYSKFTVSFLLRKIEHLFFIYVITCFVIFQSILAYNGGAVVAMKGKDCVAIATDKRYGIQAQTVSTNFPKVYQMGPTLFVGLPGLATDTQTVHQRLKFR